MKDFLIKSTAGAQIYKKLRQALKTEGYVRDRYQQDLTELLADDPIVKVPEFNGNFAMSVQSDIFKRILRNREYEPMVTRALLNYVRPDADFVDVGANIGFHSVLVAQQLTSGRVYCCEPTSRARLRLERNLQLNSVSNKVKVLPVALASKPGEMSINTVVGKEEYSSLGSLYHPSTSEEIQIKEVVEVTTIDILAKNHDMKLGIIKIDVEGFENQVLAGAENTLKNQRPVIVMELSDFMLKKNGSSADTVITFLESFKYRVFDPTEPNNPFQVKQFGDIVCIPV
jgi:FkbM family methyltransferase